MASAADNLLENETSDGNLQPQKKMETNDGSGTGDTDKKWPGWPGTSVFRLLVPSQKIGGIIGRKGEFIKKMCEESRSRIKILDGPPGIPERAVMISAKEEQEASIPPAMDGLLRVHKRLIDGLDGEHGHIPPAGAVITTRLLVAGSQAGNLIGKQGSIIKSIQEESNTVVRILGTESLPPVALQDDRIVEIQGDGIGVHKALELIASHLRKFLVDHSVLPLFEMHLQMSMTNPQLEPNVQPWVNPHVPPNAGVPGFGGNPSYIPPRQHDNYYPPAEFPSLNKQHHQGVSMFGRDAPPPMGIHSSANAQPPPPVITQVTQHMQVPLSCADAVIGTAGANISYIRRASGATVTIQETRGIPGEMTVEINGTATQVQTAQQLIQNFIAEASSTTQTQPPSADPGYSSYPSHGSMYTSPPATATHSSHPSGAYGSVYGSSYGY